MRGTEPVPMKMAMPQFWKSPPMIVCWSAFAFDVSKPAVEHESQKQLRNRFSEPMKPECPISMPIEPPSKSMSAKRCSTAAPDLRPTHPNRDRRTFRRRRQSVASLQSARSRIRL